MSRNYPQSTRNRIADLKNGLLVETGVLTNTSYLIQAQVEIFNVVGRVLVHQLFMEAVTIFGANATTLLFNFTSTTPVVAVQPMCAASAALTSLARGLRCVWVGGAVATAAVITATAGISDVISVSPQIIGTRGGVGTIGQLTAAANQTSGTCIFGIMYTPIDEGSYVSAIL